MIKYFSLFSGIGAFEKAFVNQEIPFELVGYSEIDKYASKSYSEIHGVPETMNFGDITKIDETKLPEIDFITYGFPCQDISLAGKQKGLLNEDGTKTRSGLFFDALRIIEHTQPKVAIAENVKNLTSKKFAEQFQIVLDSLDAAGYNNYWKVLNAKDYGIPQNRERVFIVSIRKDVDNGRFQFPEPYELKLRLKDVLEDVVDEKFYMKDDKIQPLLKSILIDNQEPFNPMNDGTRRTIKNQYYKNSQANFIKQTDQGATAVVVKVGNVDSSGKGEGQKVLVKTDTIRQVCNVRPTTTRANQNRGRVYDPEYISPAVNCCGGGNREPHVIIGGMQKNQSVKTDGVCTCLTSSMGTGGGYVPMHNYTNDLRIRKLTPKECFRLMGFYDEDFEKCSCSNTQLYKQAGNSIVVDVAEELLCMLFDETGNFFV